jgi:hypothetical protein
LFGGTEHSLHFLDLFGRRKRIERNVDGGFENTIIYY